MYIMKLGKFLIIPYESYSNYINLPNKILEKLSKNKQLKTPYYFELKTSYDSCFYVGVKEFTAQENSVEIPLWMIDNIGEDFININLVKKIPKGKYVKIEPMENMFFDLPENDLLLEKALSEYSILQIGQTIPVKLLDEIYNMKIIELKDENDVNIDFVDIINVDINVDFLNNYPETKSEQLTEQIKEEISTVQSFDNSSMVPIENLNEFEKKGEQIGGTDIKPQDVKKARLDYFDKMFKS